MWPTSPSLSLSGSCVQLRSMAALSPFLCNFSSIRRATISKSSYNANCIRFSHPSTWLHRLPSVSEKFSRFTASRLLVITSAFKKLSEVELGSFPSSLEEVAAQMPQSPGVYAVYDDGNSLQFIGMSKNLAASVASHANSVPDLCSSIKVGLLDGSDGVSLPEVWKSWMEEHIRSTGKVPPGNESGNFTWTVQASKKNKADLRLTPGRHVQMKVGLEELIDRLVKDNRVVTFIKGSRNAPMCGFSQRVIGILESEGVEFESVDVLDEEHNYGLREALKNYSQWPTFPQVFLNGDLLGGCDIISSMHEKGEIAEIFKN